MSNPIASYLEAKDVWIISLKLDMSIRFSYGSLINTFGPPVAASTLKIRWAIISINTSTPVPHAKTTWSPVD